MTWRDTLRTGSGGGRTHRLRSALTMLGILIGIAAVILTVGLGQGAQAEVRDQIDELGHQPARRLARAAAPTACGMRGGFGSASTLTIDDAEALAGAGVAPDVEAVAPTDRPLRSLTAGTTNWTHARSPARPRRGRTSRSRERQRGPVPHRGRGRQSAPRSWCSARHRRRAVRAAADAVGQTVTVDGVTLEVDRRAGRRLVVVRATRRAGRPGHRPARPTAQRLVGGDHRDPVSTDLRQGHARRHAVGRLPGGRRRCCVNLARHHRGRRRRLLHRHPGVDPDGRHLGRPDADRDARRHRRDLAARRRHRRHEHHAGLGHRADPRDRPAQGARRHAAGDPPPVPGRGVACSASPAACSASSSASSAPGAAAPDRPAGRRCRARPPSAGHRHRRSASASSSASTPPPAPPGSPPSTPSGANDTPQRVNPEPSSPTDGATHMKPTRRPRRTP